MKYLSRAFFLFTLIYLLPGITFSQANRIKVADKNLFLNGANVAWVNFARDIGPGNTSLSSFDSMFKELNENGGNTMRLWLHTNGSSTPEWDGMDVIGPGDGAIEDLKAILDIAHFYDVSLMLCLWSFDMLSSNQSQPHLPQRARGILADPAKTELYLQNSLIPMVDSLKGHPAIGSWEIFNEAEGMSEEFGWSGQRPHVPMTDIQRFINKAAAAIKNTDPNALVTNGAWSFLALSDNVTGTNAKNYYSDEELIGQGGEENGILDFYTVHYYPQHFGVDLSPYHNDVGHWGLDKPVVVAEFFMEDAFGVSYQDIYQTLFQRGYAGAFVWQWANRNSSNTRYGLSWPRALVSMNDLKNAYPSEILLEYPGLRLGGFFASKEGIEDGDTVTLTWNVRGAETLTLNGEPVDELDSLDVSPSVTTTYTLIAIDSDNNSEEREITITVLDPQQVNRAINKPVYASSSNYPAINVNDGDPNTRWASRSEDDEWIYIDLQASYDVHEVVLVWEAAFGGNYNIDASIDGISWDTIHEERNGTGNTETILFDTPEPARFIRMRGLNRGTQWGYSLWEFKVLGVISDIQPPQVNIKSPILNAFLEVENSILIEADVIKGSKDINQVDFYLDDQLIHSMDDAPYRFTWDELEIGSYLLSAIVTDDDFSITSASRNIIIGPEAESIRFEAEEAILTGDTEISNHSSTSGGSYIAIEGNGDGENTLTFENIIINNAGNYGLRIGYQLRHGNKAQHILINNELIEDVQFEGTANQWLIYDMGIELQSGSNTISIIDSWGWMDIDYIEIRGHNLVTSVADDLHPQKYQLHQNYPNPFNPSTAIQFQLPEYSMVKLIVFDLLGREVTTLIDENMAPGYHEAYFNASSLSSGIYLYQIQTKNFVQTRQMMLIK